MNYHGEWSDIFGQKPSKEITLAPKPAQYNFATKTHIYPTILYETKFHNDTLLKSTENVLIITNWWFDQSLVQQQANDTSLSTLLLVCH